MWSWVFLTVLDTILKALGFGTCQPFNAFKQSEDATKLPLLGPRTRATLAVLPPLLARVADPCACF